MRAWIEPGIGVLVDGAPLPPDRVVRVTLDGLTVERVRDADDVAGYVIVACTSPEGKFMATPDRARIQTERRNGVVTITLEPRPVTPPLPVTILSDDEQTVIDLLAVALEAYNDLPSSNAVARQEFAEGIKELQDLVGVRPIIRALRSEGAPTEPRREPG